LRPQSIGFAALDKRVAGFESQERTNPLLASHFRENFALEFALAKARKYRKSTGRLPKGDEYDRLYSFLIPTHRIHAVLPLDVKVHFEGRLRDAVNSTNGARPRWRCRFRKFGAVGQTTSRLRVRMLTPVALPPRRFKLATRPTSTGSNTACKPTGIVGPAPLICSAARVRWWPILLRKDFRHPSQQL
jgi:hypothetical protein